MTVLIWKVRNKVDFIFGELKTVMNCNNWLYLWKLLDTFFLFSNILIFLMLKELKIFITFFSESIETE